MVRHEKYIGPIHIAWGYDSTLQGYFLTVTDRRLSWHEDQTPEVDQVCERISLSGGGHYLDLSSSPLFDGERSVSEATIFTMMKRYDIDPQKIGTAESGATIGDGVGASAGGRAGRTAKECAREECRIPEMIHKQCARCRSAWYCSKSCQTADWPTHKVGCMKEEIHLPS